ncbi:hypothetical protein DFH28DRAFT_488269 [Melampsora americana]|nr:hypothetical protein DFH28DRAFT_488269 [Melampsora americana]
MHLNQSPSLQLASLVLITLFPIILSLPSPVFQHSSSHSSYRHHRRFTTPTDQKNLANTKDATKHVSSAPISLQSPHNLSSSSQKSNVPLDSAAPTTYTPIQADEKYDLTQASTWEELERMAEAQISASMTTLPTTVHFEEVPLSDDDFLEECEDEEDDYADVGSTNLTAANSEGNDGQTSSNSVDDWTEVPINSVTPPASPVKNDQSNDKDQKAEQDAASKKAEDAAAAKASQEGEEAEEKSDEEAAQKKSEEKEAKKEADAKKKGDEEYAKKQSDEADAKKESEAEEEKKEADEAEAKKKADEAQAKQSADEAEAKKKADEQAKKDAAAQAKADESKNKDQGSKDGGGEPFVIT